MTADECAFLDRPSSKQGEHMSERFDYQEFEGDVLKEVRELQGRLPDWFPTGPYADHLRPLDPLERREAERLYRLMRQDRAAAGERTRERVARERQRPWHEEERWTLRKRVWRERRDRERELLQEREQALLEREEQLQRLHGYHERWLDDLRELAPELQGWCIEQSHLREELGITADMLDQLQRHRKEAAERRARMLLGREDVRATLREVAQSPAHDPLVVARTITPALVALPGEDVLPVVVATTALLIAQRQRGFHEKDEGC